MHRKRNHWRIFAMLTLFKKTIFQEILKKTQGHFLPPNFCKRCENNFKCSEILVLVEFQRVDNNHEHHINFTLMALLQRVDFFKYFDKFKSNFSPEVDVIIEI